MFHSNMPVTWKVAQVSGRKGAGVSILTQTSTHLQLAGTGEAGVWRITTAAVSCLDTCTVDTCGPKTCTSQMGLPACAGVAAGAEKVPGKQCSLAYNVVHYRVIVAWQIALFVVFFLAFVLFLFYMLIGRWPGDPWAGLPGWWFYSDATSWTVKAAAAAPGVAPPTLVPRSAITRLRLDVDGSGTSAATRPAPRMYRSAVEQERTALL